MGCPYGGQGYFKQKPMKLYTLEQIKQVIAYCNTNYFSTSDDILEDLSLTPIELPIDEEIEEKGKYWDETTNPNMFTFKLAWENGAIRLKKQILNQNK